MNRLTDERAHRREAILAARHRSAKRRWRRYRAVLRWLRRLR